MAPLLEIQQIEVRYGERVVVQDVSFSLEAGEILGIVGESGSGKSTIIKAAMGLLDSRKAVTKGSIYYKGQNVLDANAEDMRKMRGAEMGMIFQNTGASLCPVRSIKDQLYESVAQHEKVSRKEVYQRALQLFDKMRLTDGERILNSYPFELSGGMNQRVGIMLAMILKPDLLFADEPTSALDVTVQAQVIKEMLKMRDLYHTGTVIVTHNIGVVEYMADKIAVMHQGRLIEYGKTKDIIYHPKKEYTKKLLGAVLRIDRGRRYAENTGS